MASMSAFPNWQRYAVPQQREQTGCIPTAFEIMLRAAKVEGINYKTFQDEFDLDKNGGVPRNHFDPIAKAIKSKYPQADICWETFPKGDGAKKLSRVEQFIRGQRPVLVSLANAAEGGKGWHIMLVVDSTDSELTLLNYVDKTNGRPVTKTVSKSRFVEIHDRFPGGDEIAFLNSSSVPSHPPIL
jgi:hypothetical protein